VQLATGEVGLALPAALPSEGERRSELALGELAYRAAEQRLSLFSGATPQSVGGEPRTEVPVSVVGMLEQEPEAVGGVREGDDFVLERYED
jgi:hypothetical protein